jgi:hypothetical protein
MSTGVRVVLSAGDGDLLPTKSLPNSTEMASIELALGDDEIEKKTWFEDN